MADTNKKATKTKKDEKQSIIEKLEHAMAEFKSVLGEKKFNNRIKKASKLFTTKKTAKPKAKKASKKATIAKKPAVKKSVPVKK